MVVVLKKKKRTKYLRKIKQENQIFYFIKQQKEHMKLKQESVRVRNKT